MAAAAVLFAVAVPSTGTTASHDIGLFPSASNPHREGFARIINHSDETGTVRLVGIDDAGSEHGPVEFTLEARSTMHFNSRDLEEGNALKELFGKLDEGAGEWRLRLESDLAIEALSYVRDGDGFVTAMHERVPAQERQHHVRFFNPGSNTSQVSLLRLINPTEDEVEVTIEGRDDAGEPAPDGEVRLTLESGEARTVTAQELEGGADEFIGSLGDGEGKWQLFVSADASIEVMNLLQSPMGSLANLSAPGVRDLTGGERELELPLFMPATDRERQGFARILNHSRAMGKVRIYGIDDAGERSGPVTLSIEPGAAVHFNSQDLEEGNALKGLLGALDAGSGRWRLRLYTVLDIEALSYVRTTGGFVTAMHELVPVQERLHHVRFFNPGSNTSQVSLLRLINSAEDEVEVTIEGRDDAGEPAPDGEVRLTLQSGEAREITARELEVGADELTGRLGDGDGKWQLFVSADASIDVMSLLRSPTGYLANLSIGSMRDDDETQDLHPVPSIADAEAQEGETLAFTVTLDRTPAEPVTYHYATYPDTAASDDYTEHSATALQFTAGERSKSIEVRTTEDSQVEPDETFHVYITESAGDLTAGAPARYLARATGTIRDDDAAQDPHPVPSIADAEAQEGETLAFTVTLDRTPAEPVTFHYATYPDTAASDDYTEHSATALQFTAGERSKSIEVRTTEDSQVEPDETFHVYITESAGDLTAGAPARHLARATGTIRDDDAAQDPHPVPSIADAEAQEGETLAFTVTLDRTPAEPVTFHYATYPDTAASDDYTERSATALQFTAGERSKSIEVRTTEDSQVEPDETFHVYITESAGDLTAGAPARHLARATGTIRDDDAAQDPHPVPRIADAEAQEGETLAFTVTLDRTPAEPVTYHYATYPDTAASDDYTEHSATALQFTAGERSKSIEVRTTEDSQVEPDETFHVYITESAGDLTAGAPTRYLARATGTIRDDDAAQDPRPVPSIADAEAQEGETLAFTVTLDRTPAEPVTYHYATYPDTAASDDYTEHSATALQFTAGERSKSIEVRTTEDSQVEPDETFNVYISESAGDLTAGALARYLAQATGTIRDDDAAQDPHPVPSIADAEAQEGETLAFTVTLDRTPAEPVTFHYATYPDTAASDDYTEHSATALQFTAGERSKSIEVRTTEDSQVEPDETFHVYITESAGDLTAGAPARHLARATGTIRDDDAAQAPHPPVPGIADAEAEEGETLAFTVTLDRTPAEPVTFHYATYPDTAASDDYTEHSATALQFTAGERSKSIEVRTTEDSQVEPDETFHVYITESAGDLTAGAPARHLARATGTIRDDDAAQDPHPVPSIADAEAQEGETLAFTVTLDRTPAEPVTFHYATYPDTAASDDYTVHSATALQFTAGERSKSIEVRTTEDSQVEPDETFHVYITESAGDPTAGAPTSYLARATGTIRNDDEPVVGNACTGPTVNIPDADLRTTVELALDKAPGVPITPADMLELDHFSASGIVQHLTGLQCATEMTSLYLGVNRISDLSPLSGLTALKELWLTYNEISDLSPLSGLTGLQRLHLGNNDISDVSPLSGLTALEGLDLRDNPNMTSISLSGLTALERLDLRENPNITSISLSGLTALEGLDLRENPNIANISLSGLEALARLEIQDNSIANVSVSGLTALTHLDLEDNSITNISLSGLTALTHLNLRENLISDISSLAGLTALQSLHLSSNWISDIGPLVSNSGLGSGDEIRLDENQLSDQSLDVHIPALRARGVRVIH